MKNFHSSAFSKSLAFLTLLAFLTGITKPSHAQAPGVQGPIFFDVQDSDVKPADNEVFTLQADLLNQTIEYKGYGGIFSERV